MIFMLDTNIASHIIKGKSEKLNKKIQTVPISELYISTITEAELKHGLAKKPEATQLGKLVNAFLLRVEILPWCSMAAEFYAKLKIKCSKQGASLSAMDMLIASHAYSINATLVTNDQAFFHLENTIELEDWTK